MISEIYSLFSGKITAIKVIIIQTGAAKSDHNIKRCRDASGGTSFDLRNRVLRIRQIFQLFKNKNYERSTGQVIFL